MTVDSRYAFYEFFCGGGLVRAGLGANWSCAFANDVDPVKCAAYRDNFDAERLVEGDIAGLDGRDLPGRADLAWASFPCQDLSLAGARAGLAGRRSGTFFDFWRLIETLLAEGRAPRLIASENVTGLLTSHGGADFTALIETLADAGYRPGALEIDARGFLPQSRPRLFVTAALEPPEPALRRAAPASPNGFHTRAVLKAHAALPEALRRRWIWWRLPEPPAPNADLAALLDEADESVWRTPQQTQAMIALMNPANRAKLQAAITAGGRVAGTLYRRMRVERGVKAQRAEVRFDGVAGCLRTPGGGSSRQFVVLVEDGAVRIRPMSAREYARLMGLPEDYRLPQRERAALHLCGDGVAVPVVRWLAEHLFEPFLAAPDAAAAAE